jgi:hypothetical protein
MESEVPVIVGLDVSVAVMVCEPGVFSVARNVPVPFVSIESAGSLAWPSLLAKCTVPEYVATTLFETSSADTVKSKAVPAVGSAEGVIAK